MTQMDILLKAKLRMNIDSERMIYLIAVVIEMA